MSENPESNKSSQVSFWANFLLVLGFLNLLLIGYLIYQRYNPQNLAFHISETNSSVNSSLSSGIQPIGIKINSLELSLSVTPAQIINNNWQASSKGVSFLKTSVTPGQKGNSILYGHNWPNLLGNLKNIRTGDKITIIYNDNSARDFQVEYLTKVSPFETAVLNNSEDYRLTLYTCTGFLDSQRLVVVAKLLGA